MSAPSAQAAAMSAAEISRDAAPREFSFSAAEFGEIARLLRAEAGIDMPPAKEPLVYARLAKRLRTLGGAGLGDEGQVLLERAEPERAQMLAALTTNVTRFFREPHHFEDLRRKVLPPLAARAKAGGRVRIWSAGCSTGMETYSIAMCVLEAIPDAPSLDVKILATDINPKVLAEGAAGRYPADALRDAPDVLRSRTFESVEGGQLQASAAMRSLITFRELNLMGDWPMKGPFDILFCRNVAIYFDEETQQRLWKRFADLLPPGGRLCIGHSERIAGPASAMLISDGVTSYERSGG